MSFIEVLVCLEVLLKVCLEVCLEVCLKAYLKVYLEAYRGLEFPIVPKRRDDPLVKLLQKDVQLQIDRSWAVSDHHHSQTE